MSLASDSEWDRATWAHWTLGIRVCEPPQGGLSRIRWGRLACAGEYTPSNKVFPYRIPVKVHNVASRYSSRQSVTVQLCTNFRSEFY